MIFIFFIFAAIIIMGASVMFRGHKSSQTLVILRLNNAYVRQIISECGIRVDAAAKFDVLSDGLFTTEGDFVCSFREDIDHIIEDARRRPDVRIIDCGISTKLFVREAIRLQRQYETK